MAVSRRAAVLFVALSVVIVGVGVVSRWYVNGRIRRVNVAGLAARSSRGIENILLVGSTDRCGLKHQNIAFGLCSQGVTGINSDVVMILHLDTGGHFASILSIPRDTFVPNARSAGAYKIDAALYEGSSQLVRAIEENFGIPINHYVELNFDAFQGVVDSLGGIRMYFPEPAYDALSGLNVAAAGCRTLDGFNALAVVRARHVHYRPASVTSTDPSQWPQDPQSDLSRIRRDHEFLRVLASSVAKRDLANPLTDRKLLDALAPQLKVDSTFSLSEMVDLLLSFHSLDPNTAPEFTLPVTVDNSSSFLYKGTDYGNVALPVEPEDHQTIDGFLQFEFPGDTMTARPLPKPASINVTVQNGTGTPNQATTTAVALDQLGFHAVPTSDAATTGPISETVVYYSSPTSRPQAQAVARALSGVVVMAQGPTQAGASVTVVTGSDFAVNTPKPQTPVPATTTLPVANRSGRASKSIPTTTTTIPNPAITSRRLSTPTASTSTLAEFDPRSCTPSGGPGP
jgi:LCP family protein required for cell wall assembly